MNTTLPLLLEPHELVPHLGNPELRVVDLSRADIYVQAHVPGALHLDYSRIVAGQPPVMGLLPEKRQLGTVLAELGSRSGTLTSPAAPKALVKAARSRVSETSSTVPWGLRTWFWGV